MQATAWGDSFVVFVVLSAQKTAGVNRADVVGFFSNEGGIIRLIGAVLTEWNEEWSVQIRYMQVEPMPKLRATSEVA